MRVRRPGRRPGAAPRRGQTMIFLLVAVVILVFVVLWNFDLHKILAVKLRSQTAGDAAALAAARWQGQTLNLIGELNILQAVAIQAALTAGQNDFSAAEALADLEARLCFVGPMTGFYAAQQAAKNNGLFANSSYTTEVALHAREVAERYPDQYVIHPYTNQPPSPTCWDDYAGMILAAGAEGVAALPDNARYFTDYIGAHLLLNPSFYDAIASSDWCWFYHNAYDTLKSYTSWRDWPALPLVTEADPMNSEYFSLGLTKVATLEDLPALTDGMSAGDVTELLARLEDAAGVPLSNEVARVPAQWFCYEGRAWRAWSTLIPENFPFLAPVRACYDYVGADAAVRTETDADRLSPGGGAATISWSAAAKPFGKLEGDERPNRYGLVLPAFTDVRLIPVDTSTGTSGGSRAGWATHIREHLPPYVQEGTEALVGGCWYCEQLRTWERDRFRKTGVDWLDEYADTCYQATGGGPGSSGGTRRGH